MGGCQDVHEWILDDRGYSDGDPQHTQPMPSPLSVLAPPPPPSHSCLSGPRGPPSRIPGPCFNCLQMGHLKAQCVMGITFNNVSPGSVYGSKSNKQKKFFVPYKSVDCSLADISHSGAHNTL